MFLRDKHVFTYSTKKNCTYNFSGNVLVYESVIKIISLTNVKAAIDLYFEIFTICIVEKALGFIKLQSLPFSAFFEQILSLSITDWGLKNKIRTKLTVSSKKPVMKNQSKSLFALTDNVFACLQNEYK